MPAVNRPVAAIDVCDGYLSASVTLQFVMWIDEKAGSSSGGFSTAADALRKGATRPDPVRVTLGALVGVWLKLSGVTLVMTGASGAYVMSRGEPVLTCDPFSSS